MSSQGPSLSDLTRASGATSVPRPPSRFATRVLLPLTILLCAGGLLAYSARDLLMPAHEVWVSPAVMKQVDSAAAHAGRAGSVVQGPGLIEPAPYPVTVPALAEGVVAEVLVLEGDSVEAGQVVAKLVDADAKLRVDLATAELIAKRHMLGSALAKQEVAAAEVEEAKTELSRMTGLQAAGGATEGELAQIRAAVAVKQRELEAMYAEARAVEGELAPAEVMLREAQLMLDRMTIVAPCAGVVMSRAIEPGMRIAMGPGSDPKESGVIRLYDPTKLQVVVDVPLADAAMVDVGQHADVSTEALPGRVFSGTVARVVHEANTARNTVQFKIELAEPDRVLKPGMLMRVKIKTDAQTPDAAPASGGDQEESMVVPRAAVSGEGESAWAWVINATPTRTLAMKRTVTLGGPDEEGYVVVRAGLRPGDRVIVGAPASLTDGARVKVMGEQLPQSDE